jgi:hypothetical protein
VGFETERWTTLQKWIAAIEAGRLFWMVRPSPAGTSLRRKSERAAATLCSLALSGGELEAQVFEGAALTA